MNSGRMRFSRSNAALIAWISKERDKVVSRLAMIGCQIQRVNIETTKIIQNKSKQTSLPAHGYVLSHWRSFACIGSVANYVSWASTLSNRLVHADEVWLLAASLHRPIWLARTSFADCTCP